MKKRFKVKLPRKAKKEFIYYYGKQVYQEIKVYLQSECDEKRNQNKYALRQFSNFYIHNEYF